MNREFSLHLAIRLNRVARGWRQFDLAQAIGVSRERVSQIELGRSEVSPAVLKRIAVALDTEDLHDIGAGRGARCGSPAARSPKRIRGRIDSLPIAGPDARREKGNAL